MLTAALLAAFAVPAAAGAAETRWGLNAAGDPLLQRGLSGLGHSPQWWACPAGAACRVIAEGERVEPGESARGTVFEVDPREWGETPVRSPLWQGRVAAALPPALAGAATPGGSIRLIPAVWSGGWGTEVSAAAVLACPSLTRSDCEPLIGPLQDKHRGWYLYAVEARGTPAAPPAVPATRPAPSALVAVSPPAGPVADAPPRADVLLKSRASRSGNRVTVGRVLCERCRVELRVGAVRRTFTVRGSGRLTVAGRKVPRGKRKRVIVAVDGLRLASERIRL